MTRPSHPEGLPPNIAGVVERALREGQDHDVAIEAVEAHLASGGERTPEVLMALAALTYEDAASLVLSRLRDASEEAIGLVDEAIGRGGPAEELTRMRAVFAQTLQREHVREQNLRLRATNIDRMKATDLVQLAQGALMRGDDDAARRLFAAADDAERVRELNEAFERETSGVVRIA